jgi:DNA polymerase III alpha subunit
MAALRDLARDGLDRRVAAQYQSIDSAAYSLRLDHELGCVERMEVADYFLIVADLVRHARSVDIEVGPGRMTAPASLLNWALGITDVDSLRHGLVFERFLNPERTAVPRIEIELLAADHATLLGRAVEIFGPTQVADVVLDGHDGEPSTRARVCCLAIGDVPPSGVSRGKRELLSITAAEATSAGLLTIDCVCSPVPSASVDDELRRALDLIVPTTFDELVAAIALGREAPRELGLLDAYSERARLGGRSEPMHALAEGILAPTHGVLVYEEQTIGIAQHIGGYTAGGADLFRRALGKKDPHEVGRHRVTFLAGAKANGLAEAEAERVFDYTEALAGYAFSKSRAVGVATSLCRALNPLVGAVRVPDD